MLSKTLLLLAFVALSSAQTPPETVTASCKFDEESYVDLLEVEGSTAILGSVHGLGPNPLHGFHIHEFGDLTDGCTSCGGHFNPYGKNHGGPDSEERHVGDLGNVEAVDGNALVFIADDRIKLSGDPEFSVLGRSIVIHEKEDDLGASGDPSGNAGSRLKCCIIEEVVRK